MLASSLQIFLYSDTISFNLLLVCVIYWLNDFCEKKTLLTLFTEISIRLECYRTSAIRKEVNFNQQVPESLVLM